MILVTGATGNVGRQVVAQLVAEGTGVRALVRDAHPDGLPEGIATAVGDLSDPATLTPALTDVDTVFLIWPFLTVSGASAVLETVRRHNCRGVYVSSSGVHDGPGQQTEPINHLHADRERLIEQSGVRWSILRSDTIASHALGWAEQIRSAGTVRGPDIAPTAVIHERDVAAVAARALGDDAHVGVKHVLTGPHVLSRAEQVHIIRETVGRPLSFEPVPLAAARQRMLADGRPPALVDALLATAEHRPASNLVTATVPAITGTPARTFREWAAGHVDDFR